MRRYFASQVCPLAAAVLIAPSTAQAADRPPPTSAPTNEPPPSYAPAIAPTSQPPAARGGPSSEEVAALVGLGVGILGVGLGVGYGIATISKKNDAQQVCSTQVVCATQDGVNKWNDADHNGTISTFAFVVGALGLLEAAVLWWLPTGHDASSTQLGLGPGGLRVRAMW
jgi:hypothetical protein